MFFPRANLLALCSVFSGGIKSLRYPGELIIYLELTCSCLSSHFQKFQLVCLCVGFGFF